MHWRASTATNRHLLPVPWCACWCCALLFGEPGGGYYDDEGSCVENDEGEYGEDEGVADADNSADADAEDGAAADDNDAEEREDGKGVEQGSVAAMATARARALQSKALVSAPCMFAKPAVPALKPSFGGASKPASLFGSFGASATITGAGAGAVGPGFVTPNRGKRVVYGIEWGTDTSLPQQYAAIAKKLYRPRHSQGGSNGERYTVLESHHEKTKTAQDAQRAGGSMDLAALQGNAALCAIGNIRTEVMLVYRIE